MITIAQLSKSFTKNTKVLSDIELTFEAGRVTALLGPNGAGKTTLLKSILGLVHPDSGEIRFSGEIMKDDEGIKSKIGYMSQTPRFPENMKVREVIDVITKLRKQCKHINMNLFHDLGLDAEKNKKMLALSGGNKQKVSAALTFMYNPEYIFLDEPTNGLDPLSSSRLKEEIIYQADKGKTVVLTSHILSEVQMMASHIVYLVAGKVVINESLESLLKRTGEMHLELAIASILKKENGSDMKGAVA